MIHIHSREDLELVDDLILRTGLEKEFDRLPDDYEYPNFGYFIVIESIEELKHPIPIQHKIITLTPEPLSDCVEMIQEFYGYSQIVCILDSDFGVSLFVNDCILNDVLIQILFINK